MKKYFLGFLVIIFAVIGLVNLTGQILAQETSVADIQYPIEELGNCQDEADCKVYCDNSANAEMCVDFAEKNDLMSKEEIQLAKNFIAAGSKGPGGCSGKDSCEQYCNDITHIDACILFAEENNLMSPAELEEAKKVQAAITQGVKPPPCGNKKACDAYCDAPEHMEECITFGAAAGFIQGKELEDAQKMLQAIKRGVTPPPCKGKEACDEYCSTPENMEVCMNFAMEAGFMSEQEKADSQKMLQALKKGIKPPNCKGKEECDVYCTQEDHFEECTNFAEAAGFMTAEEAAMARKTGGKGPGDCKGKDECEAFCNNPDNQETCFNFAKDNGLIPEEDLKQMEEGKAQMKNALETAPPEVIDCLTSLLGAETVEKLKAGTGMPSREMGDKMGECFSKSLNGGEPFGPGGCKGEECQTYCQEHPEECQGIPEAGSLPQGCIDRGLNGQDCQVLCQSEPLACTPAGLEPNPDYGPKETGPGGCQSNEECEAYCQAHPQECGAPAGTTEPGPGADYWTEPGPGGCRNETECGFAPGSPPQESIQPPSSTGPGEGGDTPPGDFVPLAPPSEPAPPAEQQPPTSSADPSRLLGAAVNAFREFFLLGK